MGISYMDQAIDQAADRLNSQVMEIGDGLSDGDR